MKQKRDFRGGGGGTDCFGRKKNPYVTIHLQNKKNTLAY